MFPAPLSYSHDIGDWSSKLSLVYIELHTHVYIKSFCSLFVCSIQLPLSKKAFFLLCCHRFGCISIPCCVVFPAAAALYVLYFVYIYVINVMNTIFTLSSLPSLCLDFCVRLAHEVMQ